MRSTDFLARYGGDELTLILHQADLDIARIVSDKILEMMKEYSFIHPSGNRVRLGVSGGIAVYPVHSRDGIDLMRAADTALYYAKKYKRGTFTPAKSATGPLAVPGNLKRTE
jgi:diguanylate cyclase (GGDEF)-like protein